MKPRLLKILKYLELPLLLLGVIVIFYLLHLENYLVIRNICLAIVAIPFLYFCFFKRTYLILGCLLLVPIAIKIEIGSTGAMIEFPSEFIAAIIAILFAISIFIKPVIDKKVLLHPITILLVFDICLLLFMTLFSEMPIVSLKRIAMRIIFELTFYFAIIQLQKKKNYLIAPYLLYAVGLIPVILIVWKAHAHYNFDPRVTFSIASPFFDDHTIYGACIAFVIPFIFILSLYAKVFSLNRFQKSAVIILLVLLLAAEFLTFSRAAILSLIVALIFSLSIKYLKIKVWHILIFILSLSTVGYVYNREVYSVIKETDAVSNDGNISNHFKSVTNITRDASNLERINRWVCAYRMFEARPFTGFGPGTYQYQYAQFQTPENMTYISTRYGDRGNAHSEYFTYLSETGIIGFVFYVFMIFYFLYFGLKVYYKVNDRKLQLIALSAILGMSTYIFHGFFNSFIDQDKMAACVFSTLAILVSIDLYHSKGENNAGTLESVIERSDIKKDA